MFALIRSAVVNACLLAWHRIRTTSLFILIMRKLFSVPPLLLVLSLSSCLKDDLDFDKLKAPDWQPGVALPLAQSSLSIMDLMKMESDSGILLVDSNNFCTLYYAGRALEWQASDIVAIPPQSDSHAIQVSGPVADLINQAGYAAFSHSAYVDFATTGGAQLDSVFYAGGNVVLQINSRLKANTVLTLTVPGATYQGAPFATTVDLPYQGTIPVSKEIKIDLSRYKLDLTDGGVSHNRLRIDYAVQVTATGSSIQAGDRINIQFGIYTTAFRALFGYFGQQSVLSQPDTLPLTVFNGWQAGAFFTIAEPEIRVDIRNSVGVPIQAQIASMTGINSSQTSFTPATGFPNPLPVPSPAFHQIGQTLTGSFTMNNANSNVHLLIQQQPNLLVSQVGSTTNPAGLTYTNFITDSSRLAVDVEVKLPLYGTARDFMLTDTLDFNYANLDQVAELLIRTHLVNGFPFEADWQIYFTDAAFLVLDSLVTGQHVVMPSAPVDAGTGLVTGTSAATYDNTFDRGRVQRLMQARRIIVRAGISTIDDGSVNVKIYSDYRFTVHLGAVANVLL